MVGGETRGIYLTSFPKNLADVKTSSFQYPRATYGLQISISPTSPGTTSTPFLLTRRICVLSTEVPIGSVFEVRDVPVELNIVLGVYSL